MLPGKHSDGLHCWTHWGSFRDVPTALLWRWAHTWKALYDGFPPGTSYDRAMQSDPHSDHYDRQRDLDKIRVRGALYDCWTAADHELTRRLPPGYPVNAGSMLQYHPTYESFRVLIESELRTSMRKIVVGGPK